MISALRGRCPGPLDECGACVAATGTAKRREWYHSAAAYSRWASRKSRIVSATWVKPSEPMTSP